MHLRCTEEPHTLLPLLPREEKIFAHAQIRKAPWEKGPQFRIQTKKFFGRKKNHLSAPLMGLRYVQTARPVLRESTYADVTQRSSLVGSVFTACPKQPAPVRF